MGGRLARVVLVVALVFVSTAMTTVASADRDGSRRGHGILATARTRVRIVDNAFRPRTITVARGTKVIWKNRGSAVHSVKATKGSWGSGLLSPGDRYRRVFRKTGTFTYYCTVHPTMKGKIVVS